jgi:Domain of unknown function (DUF5348)
LWLHLVEERQIIGIDMRYITPSTSHPAHWLLGDHELTPGDVIEVLLLDTWYRARVHYDAGLRKYQLLIDDHPFGMPLLEGQLARWLEPTSPAEGQTWEKPWV